MAAPGLRPLVLLTFLVSATCTTAWTTAYPEWTTEWATPDDRYTTHEDRYTTHEDRYTTPDYNTGTPDDRYTTPDYNTGTPDDRYTTADDRYTTADDRYTTADDRYTTADDRYTTAEPPNGTVSRPHCPRGWTLYRDNCYILANSSRGEGGAWLYADAVCRNMAFGGSLASIHDYSENSFLAYLSYNYDDLHVWTGLFYDQLDRNYRWQDATYMDFVRWNSGYPRYDPDSGCVYMKRVFDNGYWEHENCRHQHSFFCKAPSTREYLDVERDNYGCDYGFEGYGDNCYKFLPDRYTDEQPHMSCYDFNRAEDLDIRSADENQFVMERMSNLSRYQSPDAFSLHGLFYHLALGFEWYSYPREVRYHNFAVDDLVEPMAHEEPFFYMDMSTGHWFASARTARPRGMACKKPKWA